MLDVFRGVRNHRSRSKMRAYTSKLANINEGDEHTSLQDILSARGVWLSEDELWAVCLQAALTLNDLSGSAEKLQKLRIMLETVAFDSQGQVCFTDHQPDSESHYKPPEYDAVGNTVKGHLYSLGMVMFEASAYSCEVGQPPPHSATLKKLLNGMMDSDFSDRIELDGVIHSCSSVFSNSSYKAKDICKHLVSTYIQSQEEDGETGSSDADSSANTPDELTTNVKASSISSLGSLVTPSMSLQDLVEKYTTADTQAKKTANESLIISPPDQYKMSSQESSQESSQDGSKPLSSAFTSLQDDEQRSLNIPQTSPLRSPESPSSPSQLPAQYTSSATHFTPIVLSDNNSSSKSTPRSPKHVKVDLTIKELKRHLLKSQMETTKEREKEKPPAISTKPPAISTKPPAPKSILKPSSRETSTPPLTQAVRPLQRNQSQYDSSSASQPSNSAQTPATAAEANTTSTPPNPNQHSMVVGYSPYNSIPVQYMISPNHSAAAMTFVPMMAIPPNAQQNTHFNGQYWTASTQAVPPQPVISQYDSQTLLNTNIIPSTTSQPQTVEPITVSVASAQSQLSEAIRPENQSSNMILSVSEAKLPAATQAPPQPQPVAASTSTELSSPIASHPAPQPAPKPRKTKKKAAAQPVHATSHKGQDKGQATQSVIKSNSMLKKVRRLLRDAFAFGGYMASDKEDLAMAEFIIQMPEVGFDILREIIVAKYSDLFWSEDLLAKIYETVYSKKPEVIPRAPSGAKVIGVHEPGQQFTTNRYTTSPFRPIPETSLSLAQSFSTEQNSNSEQKTRSVLRPQPMLPKVNHSPSGMVDVAVTQPPRNMGSLRIRSSSYQNDLDDVEEIELDLSRDVSELTFSRSRSQGNGLDKVMARSTTVKSLTLANGQTEQVMCVTGKSPSMHNLDDLFNKSAGSAFEQDSDTHSQSSASELRVRGRLQSSYSHDWFDESGSRLSSELEFSTASSETSTRAPSSQWLKVCSTILYAYNLCDAETNMSLLSNKSENKSVDGLKKKLADITQQLNVHCKRKNKTAKYIKKILDSNTSTKKADYKTMLSSIRMEHAETVKEMAYLSHAKLQLEVLLAEQSSLEHDYIYSFTKVSNPLLLVRRELNANEDITLHYLKDPKTGELSQTLQSGKIYSLMAFLFARYALTIGYILEFFYTFRYFISPMDVLNFIIQKYVAAKQIVDEEKLDMRGRVMARALDLLTFWFYSFYTVDFKYLNTLTEVLRNFIREEVIPGEHQQEGENLIRMIEETLATSDTLQFVDPLPREDDIPFINEENSAVTRKWNATRSQLTIGSGKSCVAYQKTRTGLVSCGPKRQSSRSSVMNEPSFYAPRSLSDEFTVTDYTVSELAEQITLIEQEFFRSIHPVSFLDSLGRNINVSYADPHRPSQTSNTKSLFSHNYTTSIALQNMIDHCCQVSKWVTAEIISATNSKTQTALISHFAQMAKICKEIRNYAGCIAIKDGLDHFYIRHCSGWKELPPKLVTELEELHLKLKTDSKALLANGESADMPTLASPLLFSVHVQQLEKGNFYLANQVNIKWPKMGAISKQIDQIRLLKRYRYDFQTNADLKSALLSRIEHMAQQDVQTLITTAMEYSKTNAASKWSSVMKKVKNRFN